jgi:hypothetical protein
MGYFIDNTVEIEIDGKKVRVFKLEAEAIKAKLAKKVKTTKKD